MKPTTPLSPFDPELHNPENEQVYINEDQAKLDYETGEVSRTQLSISPEINPEVVYLVYGGEGAEEKPQAAFSDKTNAHLLAKFLSSKIEAIHQSAIEGLVLDEYADDASSRKKPFYVGLIDGHLFEVYGPGTPDDIYELAEPTLGEDGRSFSGTFWGYDQYFAVDEAIRQYKALKN